MDRLFLIVKTILKSSGDYLSFNLGKSKLKTKRNSKLYGSKKAQFAVLAIASLFIMAIVMFYTYTIFGLAKEAGVLKEALSMLTPMGIVLTGMLCFISLTSLFFLSTDSECFLALPIKTTELFVARFIAAMIMCYSVAFVCFVPAGIAYAIIVNPPFTAYIAFVLFFVMLPCVPIAITYLLALGISKLINIQKHREAFSLVMMIVLIVGLVGFQFGINGMMSSLALEDGTTAPIDAIVSLFKQGSQAFFPLNIINQFAITSFVDSSFLGFANIFIFIVINALIVVGLFFIAKFFYLRSLLGTGEQGGKKKRKKDISEVIKETNKVKSVASEYVKVERKLLFRSPMCVFQLVSPPVVFCVMLFAFAILCFTLPDEFIASVRELIAMNRGGAALVVFLISLFIISLNYVAASAVSRLGQTAKMFKTLPIEPMKQFNYKTVIPNIFGGFLALAVTVFASVVLFPDFLIIFVILISSCLYAFTYNDISLLLDFTHPTLEWDNEIRAVKNNKASLLSLLVLLVYGVIFGSLLALVSNVKMHEFIVYALLVLINIAFLVGTRLIIKKKASKLFNHL